MNQGRALREFPAALPFYYQFYYKSGLLSRIKFFLEKALTYYYYWRGRNCIKAPCSNKGMRTFITMPFLTVSAIVTAAIHVDMHNPRESRM